MLMSRKMLRRAIPLVAMAFAGATASAARELTLEERLEAKSIVDRFLTIGGMKSMGGQYPKEPWRLEGARLDVLARQPGPTVIHLNGEQKEALVRDLAARFDIGPASPLEEQIPDADTTLPSEDLPAQLEARSAHSAVWTGSELIIWGGYSTDARPLNTGRRYNPVTDRWAEISTVGAPAGRGLHTAVWTGTEMIVWGGNGPGGILNTGGRYNPSTDTWLPTSSVGAPPERRFHTAVWTGSEMIVWGGEGQSEWLSSGGRFNPATDRWAPTSETGAPAGRRNHTAVWTGSEMLVWGGGGGVYGSLSPLGGGGRYNPATDGWMSMSELGAPSARWEHTAVWTGSEMIVWGGSGAEPYSNSGGRYDPTTDTWVAISRGANVPGIRFAHTTVWTGREMIVWGGCAYGVLFDTGSRYDPATDGWVPTSTLGPPVGRQYHAAVWTGGEMILWGGGFFTHGSRNSGGRYDPATDTWIPTSTGPVCSPTPGTPTTEVCDGIDNNCDGVIDEGGGSLCTDADICTNDVCAGTSGCLHPPVADGSACTEGNACTQLDTCQTGVCTGADPVTCTASDQCHDPGTCSPATGVCSPETPKPDGSTCSDGDACTQLDACQTGVCTGADPVTCTASDQCHDPGTCSPATGVCSPETPKPDGSTCSDDDSCTQLDTCQTGVCTGAGPVTCTASDQCLDPGTCSPATGVCSPETPKPDGSTCSDGDACTQLDACQTGVCTGAIPIVCSASDQCHDPGTCSPATGACSPETPKSDGTACSDGDACTQLDTCLAGVCAGANPMICTVPGQCHDPGTCDPGTGACSAAPPKPDGITCSDGDPCTQLDACQAGVCTGADPVNCTASDACHDPGTCSPATGVCSPETPKPDGSTCSDGDACTQLDACQTGVCTGAIPIVCTAPDQCHDPGTCDPGTGVCSAAPPKPDGATCNDGDACTQLDACQAGTCQPGPIRDADGDTDPDLLCGGNDCNDTNPLVWLSPLEVSNLTLTTASPADPTWDNQGALVGPETNYELISGVFSDSPGIDFPAAICLESGSAASYSDIRPGPSLDSGFWYLARARNSCGIGSYGSSLRDTSVPPCP